MAQASYLTIAELREQYDLRLLQQLGSDSGGALTGDPPTDTDGILANAIERASSDVESHALRGNRYSATDLTDLQTADDWTLKSLVADIAMGHLFMRRGGTAPPAIENRIEQAKRDLEDLRDGREVFNSASHQAAGKAKIVAIPAADRARLGLMSDLPYFPPRRTQII